MASSLNHTPNSILKRSRGGGESGFRMESEGQILFNSPNPSLTRKEVKFSQNPEVKEFDKGSSFGSDGSRTLSSTQSFSSPQVINETVEDVDGSLLEKSSEEHDRSESIRTNSMDETFPFLSSNKGRPTDFQQSRSGVAYTLMFSPVRDISVQFRSMSLNTAQVPVSSKPEQFQAAAFDFGQPKRVDVSIGGLESAFSELVLGTIPEETPSQLKDQSLIESPASGKMQQSYSDDVQSFNEDDDDIQVVPESPEMESNNNNDVVAAEPCETPECSPPAAEHWSGVIQNFIDTHSEDSDPFAKYNFMKEIETKLATLSDEQWNTVLSSYAEFFGEQYTNSVLIHRRMYADALTCRIRRMLIGSNYELSPN